MNEECLILTSTKQPYACIGFAQDLEKELDMNFCKDHNIPYFRRETGGGTVYLDENQLFYQVIIRRDNPITPWHTEGFFRRFLGPVIKTLEHFGMKGRFVPINDLVVGEKKISGNGGGEIGECKVLIGNLLLDFDFDAMANILNVPNEEFRKKVLACMKRNLTTIKSELGEVMDLGELRSYMISQYEKLVGPLEHSSLNGQIKTLMEDLDRKFSEDKWLHQRVPKTNGRSVKIKEGVLVVNRTFKTHNWIIDLNLELERDRIADAKVVSMEGFDVNALKVEAAMFGKNFAEKEVLNTLNDLYET